MKISDLNVNQKITLQLSWGERVLEFPSFVLYKESSRVYVNPYLHNGSVVEINLDRSKGVVCTLFTIDPESNQRVSWNNVEISTVTKDGQVMYHIETANYNLLSKNNDRRQHNRIVIQTSGKIQDADNKKTDVLVHDISDNGVSFFAPISFAPESNQLTLEFVGKVEEKIFEITLSLIVERITTKMGNSLYGCRIAKENRDYLLYEFMLRTRKNGKNSH